MSQHHDPPIPLIDVTDIKIEASVGQGEKLFKPGDRFPSGRACRKEQYRKVPMIVYQIELTGKAPEGLCINDILCIMSPKSIHDIHTPFVVTAIDRIKEPVFKALNMVMAAEKIDIQSLKQCVWLGGNAAEFDEAPKNKTSNL